MDSKWLLCLANRSWPGEVKSKWEKLKGVGGKPGYQPRTRVALSSDARTIYNKMTCQMRRMTKMKTRKTIDIYALHVMPGHPSRLPYCVRHNECSWS